MRIAIIAISDRSMRHGALGSIGLLTPAATGDGVDAGGWAV